MRLGVKRKQGQLPNGAIKIGTVARRFGVSPDLLRLYEREGLLLPLKSPRGTRYFTELDFPWIDVILRLVRGARLRLAEVRRLLARIPCGALRQCPLETQRACPLLENGDRPCWMSRATCSGVDTRECYFCGVYRAAPTSRDVRDWLARLPAEAASPKAG